MRAKFSKRAAASVAGNIVAGGLIGVDIDTASGATLDHYPNSVVIRLLRIGEAALAPVSAAQKIQTTSGSYELDRSRRSFAQ